MGYLLLKVRLMGCAVFYLYWLMGKCIAYVGLPFPDVVDIYEMSNIRATVSTIVHLPRVFLPADFLCV